jgi:hypothetical protein
MSEIRSNKREIFQNERERERETKRLKDRKTEEGR